MNFNKFAESLPEPELTENAKIVLSERYLAKEDGGIIETPRTMFARVAWAVAKGSEKYAAREEVARAYYELMTSGRFMPNSPTLMNAGRSLGLLSACFVLPVEDDCESIFATNTAIGMIQRAGGGTGISLDRLRPCGSIVKSSGGTTSGPITFWRMFHATTEAIQQGAFRRGANMGMMSISHPDVLKFIFAKQSLKELTSYNISVKVPNQFMEVLETKPDTPWSLFDPLAEKEYFMPRSVLKTVIENVGKRDYRGTATLDTCYTIRDLKDDPDEKDLITVGEIFNIITRNAWRTGEPGLFFIDKADDANPTPKLGEYEATNPCVTGDTKVLTIDGPKTFNELYRDGVDIPVYAWDPETKSPVIRMMRNIRKTAESAEVLEVEFDSGLKVKCTLNHNFRTFRGNKIEARDLRIGQSIRAYAVSQHRDGHLRAHGWVANRCAHQWVHRMVLDMYGVEIPEGYVTNHRDKNPENNDISNLEVISNYDHNSLHYSERKAGGFSREGWKTDPDVVHKKISNTLLGKNHKVVNITHAGHEDVFNGTVDDVHTYVIVDPEYRGDLNHGKYSGVVSCNCGEQPLLPFESCNLGSINLAKFVKDSKNNGPIFGWKELDIAVRRAVEFLDDVIEINKFPLKELEAAAKETRKIGLGVMGFADALFKLKIPYDSKEALDFGEKVMSAVQSSSHTRSNELGKERGNFKAWKDSKYGESNFEMRNACTTTVAPTGTISIIADCSGGIEPLFSLAFERRVMDKVLIEVNKEFAAELKKVVTHEKQVEDIIKVAITKGSIQHLEELPQTFRDLFKTAQDIQPHFHVDMQAAFQKNCDSSISKTVNLPQNTAHEEVGRIYQRAFRAGCKGITVYRHKCRDVQPMGLKGDTQTEVGGRKIRVPPVGPEFYYRFQTPTGELRVHIRYNPENEKDVWEVYSTCTSGNSEIYLWADAICSTISIGLRHGTPATAYLKRMRKFISTLPANGVGVWSTQSGPQAVGRALELWLAGCKTTKLAGKYFGSDKFGEVADDESIWDICPKCKQPTYGIDPGCRAGKKCTSCHYSDGACAGG